MNECGIGIFEYWWSRVKGRYFGKRSVNSVICRSGIVAPRDLGIFSRKVYFIGYFCIFYYCCCV